MVFLPSLVAILERKPWLLFWTMFDLVLIFFFIFAFPFLDLLIIAQIKPKSTDSVKALKKIILTQLFVLSSAVETGILDFC